MAVSEQTVYRWRNKYGGLNTSELHVAWDNSSTHEDAEVEAVLRGAAGRLILLYLPTYSPWLNPIEMLWRHFRREVTHCELFENTKALLHAALLDRLLHHATTVNIRGNSYRLKDKLSSPPAAEPVSNHKEP